MTRAEHIQWCKDRAIAEMKFSGDPRQGIISMMSDLRKHEETNQESLKMLCMFELTMTPTIQSAQKFIEGFN